MTRTIDNEKTQVCCKYNDLTSTIQMNKGGYNPTIKCMCPSLLAAPQSFEGRKLYLSNVASLHNPFQVANCACTTSNSLLKLLQDGNCPCRPLQTSTSQCGALTAPAELLQGHKLHLQNLPVFTSLCAGVNCTCLCGEDNCACSNYNSLQKALWEGNCACRTFVNLQEYLQGYRKAYWNHLESW